MEDYIAIVTAACEAASHKFSLTSCTICNDKMAEA